jgi:hypothetical protein
MWTIVASALRTSREEFEAGLAKMDEIWLLNIDGQTKGFGGVRFFYPEWQGRRSCVIFTGRVYLQPSVRGAGILQKIGFRYYLQCLKSHPFQRIYWMFGAGSFKSYLLLPRNFHTYWPQSGSKPPMREQALLEAVALALDNPLYDPKTGIMSHPELVYLDGHIGHDPNDMRDPDVQYYASINPGQIRGDDVMCLCPLTPLNWAVCLARAFSRMTRPRPSAAHTR